MNPAIGRIRFRIDGVIYTIGRITDGNAAVKSIQSLPSGVWFCCASYCTGRDRGCPCGRTGKPGTVAHGYGDETAHTTLGGDDMRVLIEHLEAP